LSDRDKRRKAQTIELRPDSEDVAERFFSLDELQSRFESLSDSRMDRLVSGLSPESLARFDAAAERARKRISDLRD
jgi:hypothetical protein